MPRRKKRYYHRSGLHAVKRALTENGLPDVTTPTGAALAAWKAELVADLGGDDALSAQQHTLVELACRQRYLLDRVDAFVLSMPSPVNKRSRTLFAVVREREALQEALVRILGQLGLKRKAREVTPAQALERLQGRTDPR